MVNKSFDMGGFVSVLIPQDIANFNFKLIINYCKTNYNIMWKDKGLQLVMLPTKENAKEGEYSLLLGESGKVYLPQAYTDSFKPQYLYLLSDEEIKEGDWCIMLDDFGHVFSNPQHYTNPITQHLNKGLRKVIVCLDPSLNLPSFSDSFLEEYAKRYNYKQPMEVEVEYIGDESENWYSGDAEAVKLDVNIRNEIFIRFKEEKMYSRSEVEKLCGKAFDAGEAYRTGSCEGFKQIHPNKHDWIKENLK